MAVQVWNWVRITAVAGLLLLVCAGAQGQSCLAVAANGKTESKAAAVVSAVALRVPEKAWRHYGKAVAAARAKRVEEAEREISIALAITPAFAEPYVLRAVQEVGEGRFEAAVASALSAKRADPKALWSSVVLAGAYNGMRRYREAAAAVAEMSSMEAATWQATYEMTRAVVGMGNVAESLRWSELTLAAAPVSCMDTHILRGDAFLLAHRWSEAVVQLKLYVDSPQPLYHHAEVLKVIERATRLAADEQHGTVASVGNQASLP